MQNNNLSTSKIGVIIPYYNASKQILRVIKKLPEYINVVIIVDDQSLEPLPKNEILSVINNNTKCHFLTNKINLGVGGATKKGFEYAIKIGIEIVVKVDADDQMDLKFIPNLVNPIIENTTSITKGNRFKNRKALNKMPLIRRIGNVALSFLVKVATGYWHNFDPTNGFIAIKTSVLKEINFSNLSNRYYFETSLLSEFYFQKKQINDISMPAIYSDEKSNMNVFKMIFVFLAKLSKTFFKRIVKEYFLYDFNIGSIYILFGLPMFLFGIIFGTFKWIHHASINTFAPTGTIMIITITIILGFQLLLQAIQYDIFNAPDGTRNNI